MAAIDYGGVDMSSCSCNKINDHSCSVVKSEMLSDRIYWLTVKSPELAAKTRPGNCVMVFPSEGLDPLLGRPFAVADTEPDKSELSICYMLCGKGTDIMSRLQPGANIRVRGVLGVPLPEADNGIHIAAGGVGIAIFLLFNKLFSKRIKGLYLGIPGRGYEKYAEKILSLAPNARIFTDDASFGDGDSMFKVLPENLSENEKIWSCGPQGFLMALKKYYSRQQERLYFSLDNRMACGYGGCMGCVVETKEGMKRLCVDKSLFRADEVIGHGF